MQDLTPWVGCVLALCIGVVACGGGAEETAPQAQSAPAARAAQDAPAAQEAPQQSGNRLAKESSRFLREHAEHPIHWRAWHHAPLQEATKVNRPVMLVLGFGACHGCHELARGAFADEELAGIINEAFVPVLVDRDERPDIDAVYMAAVRLLTGGAGWPAIVFLDPTGSPFEAYTYGAAGGGDRDLREVVDEVASKATIGMDVVAGRAFEVTERLRIYSQPRAAGDVPDPDAVFGPLMLYLAHSYDRTEGGFEDRPRFVRPPALDALLRLHRRTGQDVAREMVETTLLRVRQSPLHDVVDGGFHRYARGPAWQNPAYEKTLADNAAIASILLDAWQVTRRPELAETARTTLAFLAAQLSSKDGAFYSAIDSEGAGDDGKVCPSCYYGVTDGQRARALESPQAREELARQRHRRRAPLRHEAITADANGLAISAFARAALVFEDDALRDRAIGAGDFALKHHRAGRRANATLSHCVYEDDSACGNGDAYLDDYVFLAAGLLDLFEADPQPRWLLAARELTDEMLSRFEHGGTGGFFLTAADAEPLLYRPKPDYDSALPSGNSAAVPLLMRLHAFTDDTRYRSAAERTLRAFAHVLTVRPLTAPGLAAGLDAFDDPFKTIVMTAPQPADAAALRRAVSTTYAPNHALVTLTPQNAQTMPPLPVLEGKSLPRERAAALVCESHVCRPATEDAAVLAAAIRSVVR